MKLQGGKKKFSNLSAGQLRIKRNNLKHETNKCIYDFQHFKTIKSFGENIISGEITISVADEDHSNLLEYIVEFNNKSRPKEKEGRMKKKTFDSVNALYEGRELTFNASIKGILPLNPS